MKLHNRNYLFNVLYEIIKFSNRNLFLNNTLWFSCQMLWNSLNYRFISGSILNSIVLWVFWVLWSITFIQTLTWFRFRYIIIKIIKINALFIYVFTLKFYKLWKLWLLLFFFFLILAFLIILFKLHYIFTCCRISYGLKMELYFNLISFFPMI